MTTDRVGATSSRIIEDGFGSGGGWQDERRGYDAIEEGEQTYRSNFLSSIFRLEDLTPHHSLTKITQQ